MSTISPAIRAAREATAKPRFMKRVEITPEGCWIWKGATFHPHAKYPHIVYGIFGYWDPIARKRRQLYSHRKAYELFKGPIPEGLTLDHFKHCNTLCCNPDHLEPKTLAENTANHSPEWYAKQLARRGSRQPRLSA